MRSSTSCGAPRCFRSCCDALSVFNSANPACARRAMSPWLPCVTFSASLHSRTDQKLSLNARSYFLACQCFHSLKTAIDQVTMDNRISSNSVAETMGELTENRLLMQHYPLKKI